MRKKIHARNFIFVRNLPGNLKGRFKNWCSTRNITMSEQIVKLMKETVRGSEFNGRPQK